VNGASKPVGTVRLSVEEVRACDCDDGWRDDEYHPGHEVRCGWCEGDGWVWRTVAEYECPPASPVSREGEQ
jgi:hypothetical protein